MKTRPSGATCMRGKSGSPMKFTIEFHVPLLQTCCTVLIVELFCGGCSGPVAKVPEHASTLPSGSVTAVGYHRPLFIVCVAVQRSVVES